MERTEIFTARQCGVGCLGGGASPGVIDGEVGVENRLGHRRSSPYCVEQVDGRNLTSTETRPASATERSARSTQSSRTGDAEIGALTVGRLSQHLFAIEGRLHLIGTEGIHHRQWMRRRSHTFAGKGLHPSGVFRIPWSCVE